MTRRDSPGSLTIGFLTSLDSTNRRTWSGIHYFMFEALQKHCGRVIQLGPAPDRQMGLGKAVNGLARMTVRKSYDYVHTFGRAQRLAEFFGERLRTNPPDILFAPAASTEIALLESDVPIVYSTDATFQLLQGYYPSYSRLLRRSLSTAGQIEKRAVESASAVVYPTAWAARSAVRDYGKNESTVYVIPYGANLEKAPARLSRATRQDANKCRLLFLGVEWGRKGGDIAVEALGELRARGIPAELTVVGCEPPSSVRRDNLIVIPFLNKNLEADRRTLDDILTRSHFLILPTRAEAYGIVFCEASAYGLPSIATDTGGVSGVVRNGKNGYLLPSEARGKDYADVIARVWKNQSAYRRLSRTARTEYETRLNWDCWGESMRRVMQRVLANRVHSSKRLHHKSERA